MSNEAGNTGASEHPDPGRNLPVPVPDRKLTIPEKRLAGSAGCMNCGTALQGPFCHYCGQPDKNFMRFFPVLLRELLEDTLDFDSRFMRTIKPLLSKPGKLTRDYLDGRRFRYVPPLRLYIFSSIALFFLAALLATDVIRINGEESEDIVAGIHIMDAESEALEKALDDLDPEKAAEVEEALRQRREHVEEVGDAEEAGEDEGIMIGGKPWDRETNPFHKEWLPDRVNDWVNDEIEESPQKFKEIQANPDLIKDKVFDVLPATMFVLLPLMALLLKFWYLFAKKYYIEHLIFALHNHAFIFVAFLLILILNTLAGWLEPGEAGPVNTVVEIVDAAILIWIPIYLLVSLKRVYQQGWGMTLVKYSMIGSSYMILLGFATVLVLLLSFVLL